MYDINFFKNSYSLKNKIISNKLESNQIKTIEYELEAIRDKKPTIFNIETTNYCNMKCVMCPRTIYMTRKNIWIDDQLFEKMLDKVKVYDKQNLENFWSWLEKDAKFDPNEPVDPNEPTDDDIFNQQDGGTMTVETDEGGAPKYSQAGFGGLFESTVNLLKDVYGNLKENIGDAYEENIKQIEYVKLEDISEYLQWKDGKWYLEDIPVSRHLELKSTSGPVPTYDTKIVTASFEWNGIWDGGRGRGSVTGDR